MTKGSSWGCFTPLASSSEKQISWLVRLYFGGGRPCTLFTCLWYDFLRERNEPPEMGPPVIVLISPNAVCGRCWVWSSSLRKPPCWPFGLYLVGSLFFHILLQLPFPNKLFYLLLQVPAVLRMVLVIFVKTAVFSFVTHVGRRLEGSGPFERRLVPYLGQDLINGHH